MINIGEYNELRVYKRVDFGVYLGDEQSGILLPRKWVPDGLELGDTLRVFVYTDSEDRPIATTMTPLATVGQFASMEIVDVADHGAFANWGLEKDLFIPFGRQKERLRQGQRRVVHVSLHERTGRVIGSTDIGSFFDYDLSPLALGQEVSLLVFDLNESGYLVVVEGRYRGIVYHDETFETLERGQTLTGWVKALRDDHRVDISLQRLGHGATLDAKEIILQALQAAGGSLPLHDKSSPDDIRATLKMSKKVFKKAIGGLYKERRITLSNKGIALP